jgi:hypothetical protein
MSGEAYIRGTKVIAYVALLFLLCKLAGAQDVRDIGHFWVMKGSVQLLPTGDVLKREEGRTTVFTYLRGHYAPSKSTRISERTANWEYFDWLSVDWHDQLDRNDSDIPDAKFWPPNAKVKKLVYLSPRNTPIVTVLACYTTPEPPRNFPCGHPRTSCW